ncbi:MAG: alpha-L-fucosidase [Acidobacteria bacterium]|nr:alpha-L-fucosidase [Acidobacteriota bacterium]MCW5971364.1 alpha-L-fucosidase [Blastocatellales bacterium]
MTDKTGFSRRDYLRLLGAGAAAAAATTAADHSAFGAAPIYDQSAEDRIRRMKWWHEAKFGMFIHWGLYSILGRHEWVMEMEGIPVSEYEQLARRFRPKPSPAREWAQLARRAGMKYMVMTTKHHEGFCLFDTKTTDYCAPRQAAGRDLVREYVDAVRAEGLRVGLYFSLMDWHHPDGARCQFDEAARRRFVDYTHAQIRELMTNYGKIDILWYDVPWPLDVGGWESERMNEMVFGLQPDIIVNNRNDPQKQMGDFFTPEQRIEAAAEGKAWEACMTMNDSWGYHAADDAWKAPKQVIRNLIACARDGGNYLINIGPEADGSVPQRSVEILNTVGAWMDKNGRSLYGADRCQPTRCRFASFSRRGATLYMHVHFWPGETVALAGLMNRVKSARLLATNENVKFEQDDYRVRFTGLPVKAPDAPITTIAIECDGEPKQDQYFVRRRERGQV